MILDRLLERRQSPENPKTSLANPDAWLFDAWGAAQSLTGRRVGPETAMQASAVNACVRVLAETIASLPLLVYERLEPRGKRRAPEHPLFSILHDRPNPEITAMIFRETLQAHLLLWGNAFAEIQRDSGGQIQALWPLLPDRTTAQRAGGQKFFVTHIGGVPFRLEANDVLHIPGLGFDGLQGRSPIAWAREAIGLSLAAEEYGARFFGSGATPGGTLTHPGKVSEEAQKRLKQSWEQTHQGLTQAHRIAVLEEGMKWEQMGVPNRDAEFLLTRKFQVIEIARIFRVPPHLIGDLERATFSNIEHQAIDFVVHTVRPWVVRWEQAINTLLVREEERGAIFAEFLLDGLLRGDTQSRYAAYAVGRQWGWLSADDIRELENQNPLPDDQGAIYITPMNMVPAATILTSGVPAPAPAPQPSDEENDQARRLRLILEETARRLVRNELERIRVKAPKLLSDPDGWRRWVEKFYGDWAQVLAEHLQLKPARARQYVEGRRDVLFAKGLRVLEQWEGESANALVALALQGGEDDAVASP